MRYKPTPGLFLGITAILCAGVILLTLKHQYDAERRLNREANGIIATQKAQIEQLLSENASAKEEQARLSAELEAVKAPPHLVAPTNSLEAVMNPETLDATGLARMDDLKKRYEEILVSYFLLKKCEKVNLTDYHIITSALSQEMASVNAPGRLQYDILTSAQGSYKELYANTPCNAPHIDTLVKQYQSYVAAIAKQYDVR